MALDDYGPAILASMWAMFFLTTAVVALRVYNRSRSAKLGYDDWIIVVCWLVFLATAVTVTVAVAWGLGRHIHDIPPADRPRAREGQVLSTCVVILSFAAPKFGIMATVQRATSPPTARWRRVFGANWALCAASFAFLLAVAAFQFGQCRPVSYQWAPVPGAGACADARVNIGLAYASSAFSTVLDVYFSLLPAAIIWRLQMSPRSRVVMIMVLGGASSATVASAVKMWKLGDAIERIADDPTYAMSEMYILVYVETTLLIVGSSIAAVFPVFRSMGTRLPGAPGNGGVVGGDGGTPLRTFGQGTYKKRKGFFEDDETTLTRGDTTGDVLDTSHSLEGIVKTTDVEQTWGSADAECQSASRARQLGLPLGTV